MATFLRLQVKRVYEKPSSDDGIRILVDRIWPRGVAKEDAAIDEWRKDLAPSKELRQWFNHDPGRWAESKKRYREELREAAKTDDLRQVAKAAVEKSVTLIFSAKDESHNNAAALKDYLKHFVPRD